MNCLLVYKEELIDESTAQITGKRAQYVNYYHALEPDTEIKAGVFGSGLGKALVRSVSREKIELDIFLIGDPPARNPWNIIVAVSRPQTTKKVISTCACYGVESLHLVASENAPKSYLQSKTLLPDAIKVEVLKGLEQAGDTISPFVEIHSSFKKFCNGYLASMKEKDSSLFLADTCVDSNNTVPVKEGLAAPIWVSIGPESGWSEAERKRFIEMGFLPVSLGIRTLRVETALAVMLGQLQLLSNYSIFND